MDGDGHADLVVNGFTDGMFLLRGQADGDFGPATLVAPARVYNDMALGDVTSDGRLDVVAMDLLATVLHVLAQTSDGSFVDTTYPGGGGDGTTTDRSTPQQVPGLSDVVAIAAGRHHSLAVKRDGSVWAWGWNAHGQLGDGSTTDRHSPTRVAGPSGAVGVAAGLLHSLAVQSDGTVRAWGWNGVGQLGDGTTIDRHLPVLVPGLTNVVGVAAGILHSVSVLDDGTVRSWGWNGYGSSGTARPSIAMSRRLSRACAASPRWLPAGTRRSHVATMAP